MVIQAFELSLNVTNSRCKPSHI